jgi:hypothetical protein
LEEQDAEDATKDLTMMWSLNGGFLKGKESIVCKLLLRAHYNNSKQGRENLCQITSSSVGICNKSSACSSSNEDRKN